MRITKKNLRRLVREAMELDLEIGDVILAGKFKNKRKIVKDIGKDDLGQPTINGMKVLNFRIEKLMPKDKWSKKSKEALEFAKEVNEMKITKRQLRRIMKEQLDGNLVNLGHQLYAEVAYDMVDQAMATANVAPDPANKEQVQQAVDELFSSSEYDNLLALLGSLSEGGKW